MKRFSKKTLLITAAVLVCVIGASFYFGRSTPEEKEAKYIRRGIALYEKGEYAKARIEYKNALRLKPTDAEVAYRLGLIEEAEGSFQNAYGAFNTAEQQDPHFRPARLKLAQYHILGNSFEQGQKRLDDILKEDPDNAEAHALLASLALRKKDHALTEKEANFALSKDPANITAATVLTGLYLAQNDTAKAEAAIDNGITHNPKEVSLYLLKAVIFEKSGDLEKTKKIYQDLFKLRPEVAQYRSNLSTIYKNAGKLEEAEATLREGIKALPDDQSLSYQLIAFLDAQRGFEAAEKEIISQMAANPKQQELPFILSSLYLKHNDQDKAAAVLESIVKKDPSSKSARKAGTSLARLSYMKGDKADAKKRVAAVLEQDSTDTEALLARATMAFEEGLYQDSITDLRAILRVTPKEERVFPVLAEALLAQGHADLAIDTLNQLLDLSPNNHAIRVRLAQMYRMNGNANRANDLLDAVIRKDPTFATAWETKARFAIDTKDFAAADAAIKTLDKLEGQHLLATFLQAAVSAESGKNENAIVKFSEVVLASPDSPLGERALTGLVDVYSKTKQLDKAISFIEQMKSEKPAALTMLGISYQGVGKIEEAKKTLDRAIAAKPDNQVPFLARADLDLKTGKPLEALKILDQAFAALPNDSRAPMMAADQLIKLNRNAEALALYDKVLALNPENPLAVNNWASIVADLAYTDAQKLEMARQRASRFADSKNPLLLDTLAWLSFRQGQFQQAKSIMERAMSLSTSLPEQVHYHYGAILMKTGQTQQAKEELRKATAGQEDYIGLQEAKELLKKE